TGVQTCALPICQPRSLAVCPVPPEPGLHASDSYPQSIRLYITSSGAFASAAATDGAVSRFPPPWDNARGWSSVLWSLALPLFVGSGECGRRGRSAEDCR